MAPLYALIAVLLISNIAIPTVTLVYGYRWRKEQEDKLREARKKHIGSLHEAEMSYLIAREELCLDSRALQFACHELSQILDENDAPAFGDWSTIRENLRQMARDQSRIANEKELRVTYNVPIEDQR